MNEYSAYLIGPGGHIQGRVDPVSERESRHASNTMGLNYAPASPHTDDDAMATTQARTEEDQG
jgi:hypothetical protein